MSFGEKLRRHFTVYVTAVTRPPRLTIDLFFLTFESGNTVALL